MRPARATLSDNQYAIKKVRAAKRPLASLTFSIRANRGRDCSERAIWGLLGFLEDFHWRQVGSIRFSVPENPIFDTKKYEFEKKIAKKGRPQGGTPPSGAPLSSHVVKLFLPCFYTPMNILVKKNRAQNLRPGGGGQAPYMTNWIMLILLQIVEKQVLNCFEDCCIVL